MLADTPALPLSVANAAPSTLMLTNFMTPLVLLAAPLLLATSQTESAAQEPFDLASVYAGTLDHEDGAGGVDWSTHEDDVWQLSSFRYELPGKLELAFGPSTLIVAKHEAEHSQRSVVWATVLPDEIADITSSEPGHGDAARSLFLRFHPSLIGELFPAATVSGRGDALSLVRAKRLAQHKLRSSWQWDGSPVVPARNVLVFDIDTASGARRFYMLDADAKTIKYEPAFKQRALKPLAGDDITSDQASAIFAKAWAIFDETYPYFVLKQGVDWPALRDRYAPLAARARSTDELAGVIGLLVTHLEDLHVWVKSGDTWVPTHNRFRVTNGNFRAIKPLLTNFRQKPNLVSGRVNDDLGYMLIDGLAGDMLSDDFDAMLDGLRETKGLILDLRFNGGGDELLGKRIAGRFLAEETVYSTNKYRSGKKHDDFGETTARVCEPRGPWRYTAPVIVLQGAKTMSSGESLVLMLSQAPNVTTMGAATAGASANPKSVDVGRGIVVNVPCWFDMDADGRTIEGVGIAPEMTANVQRPGHFRGADPVFAEAMARTMRLIEED